VRGLPRSDGEPADQYPIAIRYFVSSLAILRKIGVSQDCKEPRAEIAALDERAEVAPGLDERFLNKILGAVGISAEGDREGAQPGNARDEFGLQLLAG